MPLTVNPILSVVAAQGPARDLVLQPGTVVDAKVMQLLADNLVRIAIANLSIDVVSEVPLQAGQALQLAVSQTESGIRLAVIGQGAGAAADAVTLTPGARVDAPASPAVIGAPAKNILTPIEKLAVSMAAQAAATQQGSLAPLFADASSAASSHALPANLQAAVTQLLAQRTSLDQNLTGSEIKNAFQKSGLFLEASLASGSIAPGVAGVPDLKAALIVLRQTLLSSLAAARGPATSAESPLHAAASPALAPSLSPDVEVQEILLPQTRLAVAVDSLALSGGSRAAAGAALTLLQEGLQELGKASPSPGAVRDLRSEDVTFHTNMPPPPFRGAQPTAQPVALPSLSPDAPLATTAHHLLGDTDAAIARQTLLQVASLPDRVDASPVRIDPAAPRWHFEIPFATPQGTALAQFEISRDGGGSEVKAAKRVWRARFSLDVEPAGPVHALVSLVDEKTSVRMWAERPATAAQLRAGAAQLSQALSRAELVPGDIVIRDGTPPQSAPAPAGHFLDRAL
ncbi:flagellar hook-length control protein FliK [Bradyrhizobium sediminis]|uniref:Flagellar hook-length control protein FliK n=1 Tax=Bradyrhizobium sediminis TaxID=2840469 RepID=A0A975NM85_9BRAD|nr:flagellar hook-length control protein FliK [Bradyrhizobium sediminis]QWG16594.1 flagellar hook-length control protein FliK [Bradyrhizobium sediminis]